MGKRQDKATGPTTGFVVDGPDNYAATDEYQTGQREVWQMIVARYAGRMAAAGPIRRLFLRYTIRREFKIEWEKIAPSKYSLW
jgi:hypothetical protein